MSGGMQGADTSGLADIVMTTTGDMVDFVGGARARLPIGSELDQLTVSSGVPAWVAPSGGGALWEQAYQTTITNSVFDTGTVTFKKYIQAYLSWSEFDLAGGTNYQQELKFNNSAVTEYDSRYMQNANSGTSIGQADLNFFKAGGTMTEDSAGACFISLVNISGQPKYGLAQGSWYVDGEAGGYFNRSSVWFQWTNSALVTQIEIDPNFADETHKYADATLTVLHSDG